MVKLNYLKSFIQEDFLEALLGTFHWSIDESRYSFDKECLAPLATLISSSAINGVIQRKMRGRGVVEQQKESLWSSEMKIWMTLLKLKNH